MNKSCLQLINDIIDEKGFATEFDEESLNEAKQAVANTEVSATDRRDYRQQPLITIDDKDAKDFDDAVCCSKTPNGGVKLIVAISDVCAYVDSGSVLDAEAQRRGTSVYLPERVLPMLPTVLSNGSCSLSPGQERLCLACEMDIKNKRISKYRFFRGIMRSSNRLTYDEAAVLMENKDSQLGLLAAITRGFRQMRESGGGLLIERAEQKININGDIISVQAVARNIAHFAIEECMIAANRCAADFIIHNRQLALHRVHKPPTAEGIHKLRLTLEQMKIKFPKKPLAQDFGKALANIDAQSAMLGNALLPAIFGTLGRAYYAPDAESGHFGLACSRYTHFTSPIRRYPDIIVHRALIAILNGEQSQYDEESLTAIGDHCSEQEQKSDKATWACRQRLLCEAAKDRVGETFSGVVSGTVEFGFFVSVPELNLDGLVQIADMPGYWRRIANKNLFVKGNSSIGLGDKIELRLKEITPEKGQARFIPQNV